MNAPRIQFTDRDTFFHCISRTTNGDRLFSDRDCKMFRKMLAKVSCFTGVEIITFCVLSNHFHLLVRVPPPTTPISDQELIDRYTALYDSPSKFQLFTPERLEQILKNNEVTAASTRILLLKRMHNISMFMQLLKQRFSIWFNRTHNRFGTLWASRYKAITLEGRGRPLTTVALYIDLNPVRAGITDDPSAYSHCGFSEASRGSNAQLKAIQQIAAFHGLTISPPEAFAWYREALSSAGADPLRKRRRVPDTFSHGLVLGNRSFVDQCIRDNPEKFSKTARRSGPFLSAFQKSDLPGKLSFFTGKRHRKSPHTPGFPPPEHTK